MNNTVVNNIQQFVRKANVLLDDAENHKEAAQEAKLQDTLDMLTQELELKKHGGKRRKSRRKSKKRRKSRRKSKKRRKRTKKRRRRRRR